MILLLTPARPCRWLVTLYNAWVKFRTRRTLIASVLALACAGLLVHVTRVSAEDQSQNPLLQKADVIAQRVAKIRGLPQKRPIERGVMSRDQIRKRLLQRIDEEYSPEELAGEELALKRMGLLPPDTDYKKLVIDVLSDQIAGFYDPAERRLYIAGWTTSGASSMDEMLMAHEIDHALQDQHFDLRTFMKPGKKNSDEAVARQSLVEGDGTALMIEYMMRDLGVSPWDDDQVVKMMETQAQASMGDMLDKAPLVLRKGLMFPYVRGLAFVAHYRRNHEWSRIDEIFRKPPLSTEHILHPAKYESYERPHQITARSVPALRGYREIFSNINGELGFDILLRQHVANGDKNKVVGEKIALAAAGWGGDRVVIYAPQRHDGEVPGTIGISYSVWDQAADAIEFFDMIGDAMPSLSQGKKVSRKPGAKAAGTSDDAEAHDLEYVDSTGHAFIAQRRGDVVVLVLGAPADKARPILSEVWKRWKIRRR